MKQARPVLLSPAALHLQLRSPQVASDQKSTPAMPITLIVAVDNFLTRHHVFMKYKFCCTDAGKPRSPRSDRTLSRAMKGHQVWRRTDPERNGTFKKGGSQEAKTDPLRATLTGCHAA